MNKSIVSNYICIFIILLFLTPIVSTADDDFDAYLELMYYRSTHSYTTSNIVHQYYDTMNDAFSARQNDMDNFGYHASWALNHGRGTPYNDGFTGAINGNELILKIYFYNLDANSRFSDSDGDNILNRDDLDYTDTKDKNLGKICN